MATEDKTGELPIPPKKPHLVPLRAVGEEEKTKDLPTPAKIKDMITKANEANDEKIQKEITEIKAQNVKLQTDLQKVSAFLAAENKKIVPLLEKNLEDGKKNSDIYQQKMEELTELKNLISKYQEDYKNDYNNLEIRKAELISEVANLESVSETYHKTKTQYDSLADEYSLLTLQKHELEQEMLKLVIGGKEEVVNLQTQKVKCEAELAWIKFELNEYYSKKATKETEEAGLLEKQAKLTSEIQNLEIKHQEITAQYHEKFTIISNFQEQCDKFTHKIEELKLLEAEEKEDYNRLQIQKKNCEQALAFINIELHEYSIKKETMQFEDADLDQKRVALGKEISILEKKHHEATSAIRSKTETLTMLQSDCEKAGRNLEALKKQEIFEKNEISRLASEKMHCEHQVSLIKLELHEFSLKKEQKLNEEIELDKKRGILEQKISSLELKLDDTSRRLREKTDAFSITHEEWTALCSRIEHLKIQEHNLKSDTSELKDELSKLKDAASFSEEKRAHYQAATKEAEDSYKIKMDLYEKDYQYKVATMELELKKMEENGLAEVKARIDETQEAIHQFLNKNQDLLAEAIGDVVYVKGQYSLVKADTAPHFDEVKNEIKKVIGSYFHQSVHPNYKEKIMQKIYFYWATSASIIAAGSILLWFFKK